MSVDVLGLIAQTDLEARPYQQRIIKRVHDSFMDRDLRSVLINSPTGSGKTPMALLSCKLMQNLTGCEIAWVAMRRNLLTQAARENESKRIGAKIHWCSMFDKTLPEEFLTADKRMLVHDEAQHDAASSAVHLHSISKPHYILGCTATAFRTDRVKLCFDTVINDAGIGTLIRDGYLAAYNHYTIPKHDPKSIASFYLREPDKWGKSLISFHRHEQCEECCYELRRGGITCDVVTASTDREEQIDHFKSGKLQVLTNCMILNEGFDCPDLQSVFCRDSCKSVVMQTCGRAFRKFPGIEFKNIIQSEGTRWPFMKTATPVESYLWKEEQWLALSPNKQINEINCRVLVTLAGINTKLPDFITKANMSRRGRYRRRRVNE